MKAITIKQPWAQLIAQGIKDIENRTWKTKFRGKVLIHTSAKSVDVLFSIEQSAQLWMNGFDATTVISNDSFPTSAIIGEVEIIDCVINHESIWAESSIESYGKDEQNREILVDKKPIYNWVLANAVLYKKPILNVKGKLSFWEPEVDIVECIGCSEKFNFEEMDQDDASENYCKECWEHFSPIMAHESKENNYNWISIQSENDLPIEEHELYFVYGPNVSVHQCIYHEGIKDYWLKNFSHWQPINKPEKPIY